MNAYNVPYMKYKLRPWAIFGTNLVSQQKANNLHRNFLEPTKVTVLILDVQRVTILLFFLLMTSQ